MINVHRSVFYMFLTFLISWHVLRPCGSTLCFLSSPVSSKDLNLSTIFLLFEKVLPLLRAYAEDTLVKCSRVSVSNSKNQYSSLLTIPSLQKRSLQCSVSIPVKYVYNLDLPRASHAVQFVLRVLFCRPYFAYF